MEHYIDIDTGSFSRIEAREKRCLDVPDDPKFSIGDELQLSETFEPGGKHTGRVTTVVIIELERSRGAASMEIAYRKVQPIRPNFDRS